MGHVGGTKTRRESEVAFALTLISASRTGKVAAARAQSSRVVDIARDIEYSCCSESFLRESSRVVARETRGMQRAQDEELTLPCVNCHRSQINIRDSFLTIPVKISRRCGTHCDTRRVRARFRALAKLKLTLSSIMRQIRTTQIHFEFQASCFARLLYFLLHLIFTSPLEPPSIPIHLLPLPPSGRSSTRFVRPKKMTSRFHFEGNHRGFASATKERSGGRRSNGEQTRSAMRAC